MMTKKSGTNMIARIVAANMPPATLMPIAFCPPAPAPLETASGRMPPMKAKDVIRIGRSRSRAARSEEHTSEIQSLMRISYAVFCLKTKINDKQYNTAQNHEEVLQKK